MLPKRIFHGRRMGRKLNASRADVLANGLPRFGIELDDSTTPCDPLTFFDQSYKEAWLEIGFGNGEHLLEQAKANPDIAMIGCEPFINGVSALLRDMERDNVENIRIWPDDARLLMDRLQPQSLQRCFILHPDPWPKKRHHKRRFVQTQTLDRIAALLADGAELRMATDDMPLAEWMLYHAVHHPAFHWAAMQQSDWTERPEDWPQTRYETKARGKGESCIYLKFLKKS